MKYKYWLWVYFPLPLPLQTRRFHAAPHLTCISGARTRTKSERGCWINWELPPQGYTYPWRQMPKGLMQFPGILKKPSQRHPRGCTEKNTLLSLICFRFYCGRKISARERRAFQAHKLGAALLKYARSLEQLGNFWSSGFINLLNGRIWRAHSARPQQQRA
jgi:hypothetical protein